MKQRFTAYTEILRISLPVSLALLIPFLNISVNNYFLSSLGELELGTAGITGVYYLLLAMLGTGLHSAIQSIIARKTGEDNPIAIGKIFRHGLYISLFFSMIIILVSKIFLPQLLLQVLHHNEVRNAAISFVNIRVWGLPFLFMFQLMNALFMGTTNTRLLIYGTVVQAGANILFDYLLIFGKLGFPALGYEGAAWASVIAEVAGMLIAFTVLFKHKFHKQFHFSGQFRYDPQTAKNIISTSLPLMAQYAISLTSWLYFYLLIEHMGERSLAISNLMRNLFSFTGIFIWALASTTNTMVSMMIGQKRENDVINLIISIMKLGIFFSFLLLLLINFEPRLFLGIFGLNDAFIDAGIPVLQMVSFAIMLQSASVVWLNAVTGTGKTRVNLVIELIAVVFYGFYIYAVIEIYKLDLIWAWASEIIYWIIILSLSVNYIYSEKWKSDL
jgi:putative MATE family efflux protein